MKKIKVSIKDENTLVLLEDASEGDVVDLKSLHDIDIDKASIENVVRSIKMDQFNAKLKEESKRIENDYKKDLELKEREYADKTKDDLSKKEKEIIELQSELKNAETKYKSKAEIEALRQKQKIEEDFREELKQKDEEIKDIIHQKELGEEKLKQQLQSSETALISLKEMRTKMSTKMVWESLEIHCENEFNRIRSMAFPNADFRKDNDASWGTKWDYIYRELDSDWNEILSIMFEMKNEIDTTSTKKKNSDFFKKLDSDRTIKKCEYAVLVSLLERDNEYYDDIVTIHEYHKMYAIRPQHFITIIGFLREACIKSQHLQREIQRLNNQNIDVTNFEANMNDFKEAFSRNYNIASKQFSVAIDEIDKTIDHLNKVKDNLLKSDNNLRLANNKATDLAIKRLTKDSPSVQKAFEEQ